MAESRVISQIVNKQVPMQPLTAQQKSDFDNATTCFNCDRAFLNDNWKSMQHDYISAEFLYAACNNCNLQLKPPKRSQKTLSEMRVTMRVIMRTIFFYQSYSITDNITIGTSNTVRKICLSLEQKQQQSRI